MSLAGRRSESGCPARLPRSRDRQCRCQRFIFTRRREAGRCNYTLGRFQSLLAAADCAVAGGIEFSPPVERSDDFLCLFQQQGELRFAILSHTWGADEDEVTFDDIEKKTGENKAGYAKLWFCANQAKKDGLDFGWVDSCCINKANLSELSKAITSMFRWYQHAAQCYVYLSDVSVGDEDEPVARRTWEGAFRTSRWFTRGWTLQELLAPASVEFFSVEGRLLGNKQTLEGVV